MQKHEQGQDVGVDRSVLHEAGVENRCAVAIKRPGYFGLASRPGASRLAGPHSSIDGLAYLIDRNTKANPHVASRGTGNRGSNSNKLSAQVHEWTT